MNRPPYDGARELHVLEPGRRTRDEFAVVTRTLTVIVLGLAAWGVVALLVLVGVIVWRLAT